MATGQRGFTLIELLVVLLIMGIFVGLVSTITQPDDRALVRVEAERLAQLLDLAATKSRLTGLCPRCVGKRMRDEGIVPRFLEPNLEHGTTTNRHRHRLHAGQRTG